MKYHHRKHKTSQLPRRIVYVLMSLVLFLVLAAGAVRVYYARELRPVSAIQQTQVFSVQPGDSVKLIAAHLETKHLIRSAWALELYVHSKELSDKLQAGTYAFSPSDGTIAIVKTMTRGAVSTKLVTILPGKRLDQIRTDLINDGFSPNDVDQALLPDQYAGLPALAFKPANITSLEGLLWPDSFQKDATTAPATIIRESLTETGQKLTPDVQAAFAAQGLTTYQGLTLASIITKEVSKPADQAQVAQVFLTRLKQGMVLGSDVTALYASIAAGQSPSLTYDSPYNTLIQKGLPPSPISTVTANALNAAVHPADTTWLYFVAGDDGTTYFSNTFEEHQAQAQKYCHKLCPN